MKRPPFTLVSFLKAVFKPASNPQPTGLRKKHLKGLRGGRKTSRLTAYNRMNPRSQQILESSGMRDSYLRGETTLAEARRKLRETAVNLGVAKPLPQRPSTQPMSRSQQIRAQIDRFLVRTLVTAGKNVNPNTVRKYSVMIPEWVIDDVPTWDAGQIASAAQRGSIFDIAEGAALANPFWYR